MGHDGKAPVAGRTPAWWMESGDGVELQNILGNHEIVYRELKNDTDEGE